MRFLCSISSGRVPGSMVDAGLIVSVICFAVLIMFCTIVMVIYFGHPDDKNTAWLPKIIVVFGFWLAFASVLVLPYDVANSRGEGGGIRVDLIWYIVYCTLAVLVTVVIPFAFFYYEAQDSDDSSPGSQICSGIKYTLGFAVVFLIAIFIAYSFGNNANIRVHRISRHHSLVQPIMQNWTHAASMECNEWEGCLASDFNWVIPVTFPIYVMAFLAFIGWWTFACFVGVGMVALPFDLIAAFRSRPKPMSTKEYFEERQRLGARAKKLQEIAEAIQKNVIRGESRTRRQKIEDRNHINTLQKHFHYLKKDVNMLHIAHKLKGGNPLVYIGQLFFGIISAIISITWLLHIWIFILPRKPVHGFLNNFFVDAEEAFGKGESSFGFFGVLMVAIWSLYLLAAAVKGNFKLGMRIAFWKVYPMEWGNTMMNAFLVNTWIILLCSVPAVQFCASAFPIYARYTAIDMLFGTQIRYLDGFRWFWVNDFFVWAMMLIAVLSAIYLSVRPRDVGKELDDRLDSISKEMEPRL